MKKGIHIIRRLMEPWPKDGVYRNEKGETLLDVIMWHRNESQLDTLLLLHKSLNMKLPITDELKENMIRCFGGEFADKWLFTHRRYLKETKEKINGKKNLL